MVNDGVGHDRSGNSLILFFWPQEPFFIRLSMVPSTYTIAVASVMMCCPFGDISRKKETSYFLYWVPQTFLRTCTISTSHRRWSGVPLYPESSRPPSIFLFLSPTFCSLSMESHRGKRTGWGDWSKAFLLRLRELLPHIIISCPFAFGLSLWIFLESWSSRNKIYDEKCLKSNLPHPSPETINRIGEYLPETGSRERR